MLENQAEWPLLVIAPASLRLNWAEELEKWLPLLRPAHVRVIEGREDRLRPGDSPKVQRFDIDLDMKKEQEEKGQDIIYFLRSGW